jgi:hypothetical protein
LRRTSGILCSIRERPDLTPIDNLGIAIESPDQDALAYHESHGVEDDGSYTLGLIPPGHYVVRTYVEPDFQTESIPNATRQWKMAKREVDINSDAEVVLTLTPLIKQTH